MQQFPEHTYPLFFGLFVPRQRIIKICDGYHLFAGAFMGRRLHGLLLNNQYAVIIMHGISSPGKYIHGQCRVL